MAKKRRGKGEGSIYQRSDGLWSAQITIGINPGTGKPQRKTFYGKTRSEVAQKLTKALHEVQTGNYIEPSAVTVEQWFRDWIKGRKPHLEESTYNNYNGIIEKHIIPAFGKTKLKDLKTRDIQGFINEKFLNGRCDGKGGLSPESIRYIKRTFNLAFNQAEKEKLISHNPAGKGLIELPKMTKKEMETLNQSELDSFLGVCKESDLFLAYLLETVSGMRRGELLGVRWQDLDMKNRILKVRQMISNRGKIKGLKTKSSRRDIVLNPAIIELFKRHKSKQNEFKLLFGKAYQNNDLIFCNEDGSIILPRTFFGDFKRQLKKAGIEKNIRFHDMRHTFATLALEAGISPRTMQEILGHADIRITLGTYSHVTKLMQEEAAATMTNKVLKHMQ